MANRMLKHAHVVFIDAGVPDIDTLLAGLAPGERAFVVDPTKDGLAQIAADLQAAHLTDLASIAIVAHGAPGSLTIGSTVLDDGDLAQHAKALATIGKALGHKGKLALYACDVAQGAAGRTFITDLSHEAGGVDVAAATHDIGKTATGENWTLDAATGANATPASTPFKAAAVDSYQGTLATGPDGQLVIQRYSGDGSFYLNSNATTPTQFQAATSNFLGDQTNIDPALGIDFEINSPGTFTASATMYGELYYGAYKANSSSLTLQPDYDSYYRNVKQGTGNTLEQDLVNGSTGPLGFTIDPVNHVLYLALGSANTSENGFLAMNYTVNASGAPVFSNINFLETTKGGVQPSYPNDPTYYNGNIYYLDDQADAPGASAENAVYRISTTGNPTPVEIVNPTEYGGANSTASNPVLLQSALDGPDNRLYVATATYDTTNEVYTNFQIYVLNNASTASNGSGLTKLTYSGVAQPTFGVASGNQANIGALAYDEASSTLYVDDDIYNSTSQSYSTSVIDELHLGPSGTVVTSITTIPNFDSSSPGGPPVGALAFTALPTLTATGTSTAVSKTTPVTLLAGAPTVTSADSGGFLQSASVTINDATNGAVVTGDTLGLVKAGTFTAFTSTPTAYVDNGHTFDVSYASGVLTIANLPTTASNNYVAAGYENTTAAYQQVLQDVQYRNNSTNTDNRTATFQVNNGAIGNPSGSINTQSFAITVDEPPSIAAGGYAIKELAGVSVTTGAGAALTGDSDPNGGTLTITGVATSGGAVGTVGQSLTGTYGALTLNANGSYTYTAGSAASAPTGSHPIDGYTFTVSNAGGTASESFNATIDRAPTGTGIKMAATEGKTTSGSGGAAFKNETDPDGDALTVASVSYTNPTTMMTTAGTVGTSLAGQYGELTLNANGSYSYLADQTVAFSAAVLAGQKAADDFTYTSSDGLGGTTGAQTLEFDVTCYASGTRIRTVRGDVPVESLAVGDLVVTASGAARPIRWLGHRALDCRRHPRPQDAHPIRIAAHALAPNRPSRDLFVSPGHSICIDVVGEVLIPAFKLVNGSTIQQIEVDAVTYWHVELDSHDVILAEDLPAESYLDMGNRPFFAESAVVALGASPDAASRTHADFCRPFHMDGRLVEVVRAQLSARARDMGWRIEDQRLDDLHLLVDGVYVAPEVRGFVARFAIPAAARDVWLVSPTSIPATVGDWPDLRSLGACLKGFEADDGFGACQTIEVDDPRLCIGFHAVEREGEAAWRWTAGRARLPASLWADPNSEDSGNEDLQSETLESNVFLRVRLAGPMLPLWVAPAPARSELPIALAG